MAAVQQARASASGTVGVGRKIDEHVLKSIDLKSLNGGVNPYPPGDLSLERTFARPIAFYRETVADVVGATGGRVLDLLCGAGRWSVFLAEQNDEVVGIDRLPGCATIGAGLCRRLGLDNATFHAKDVSFIESFADGSFDTVWMFSALQYVERRYTLQQAYRVLRAGGTLFVGSYNSDGMMLDHLVKGIETRAWNQGASQWALEALVRGEQADGNPSFITVAGAAQMCERFGFELVAVKPDREFYPQAPNEVRLEAGGPDGAMNVRQHLLKDYVPSVSFVARKERKSRAVGRQLKAAIPDASRVKRLVRRILQGSRTLAAPKAP